MPDCEGFFQPQSKQQIAVTIIFNQHGRTKCKAEEEEADFYNLQSCSECFITLLVHTLLYVQKHNACAIIDSQVSK